jgi:radical SAM superfamily enzyme YgiQ (UPF0313 family)
LKVLLVSANTETINMPVLPLGLGYVAAATQNAGYNVKLLNLLDQKDSLSFLKRTVHDFRPDVIGISVRNIDDQNMERPRFLLAPVKNIISECQKHSNAIIVLGGAGYSIFPQAALDYLDADLGIQGEGELAFLELLNVLSKKKEPFGIPGVYFPGQRIHCKPKRIKRLADHPLPLPNQHIWANSTEYDEKIWLPIQTRRGCPMNCSYCSTFLIEGRTIRKYPPEKVVAMVSHYVDANFDHFFFVDNTFNLPSSYAKSLCMHLADAELNNTWRCILYPWKVDEELVKWMARAGCKEVAFGFESGCEQILRTMKKQFNPQEVRRISHILKDYGIRQMGFLLLGGPGETKETVKESLFFADSLNIETVKVTVGIRIYPHTELAATAVQQGLISADDDLLFPRFYLDRKLEKWLPKTVKSWIADRPNWTS